MRPARPQSFDPVESSLRVGCGRRSSDRFSPNSLNMVINAMDFRRRGC